MGKKKQNIKNLNILKLWYQEIRRQNKDYISDTLLRQLQLDRISDAGRVKATVANIHSSNRAKDQGTRIDLPSVDLATSVAISKTRRPRSFTPCAFLHTSLAAWPRPGYATDLGLTRDNRYELPLLPLATVVYFPTRKYYGKSSKGKRLSSFGTIQDTEKSETATDDHAVDLCRFLAPWPLAPGSKTRDVTMLVLLEATHRPIALVLHLLTLSHDRSAPYQNAIGVVIEASGR
ncbi:hypothetical protein GWI33_023187 [Rhynchophorus ferrugineus]|uniref:Uncharacterized protein n=1 Tax=Rhynchophorus ferrugineus TaxID=354439 RepID=A0A834MH21_RHYFE|nr:hypothetical protein GWI33_023187 [Rhynchophorus ferrugineus]